MEPVGTDFLQLHRAEMPTRGLTTWLVDAVRAAVADGRLPTDARLPSTRVLADDLGLSRGVVVEAYRRLADEGLLVGRTGAGTVIAPRSDRTAPITDGSPDDERADEPADDPGDDDPTRTLAYPLPARPTDVELDLSPGLPDLSAFPRGTWLRAEKAVLATATAGDLGYGDPRGSARLRTELASWLNRTRGLRITAEDVVVVAGVAQALAVLAQVLRARGEETIAVEDPGSRGARFALAHWGLDPAPIGVDDDGVVVEELIRSGLRTAMLTPAHQFPTGVVLAPERRRTLLRWAAESDALVVEDDYDAEHRYDRAPVPALHASAPDHVAYTGSTSKILAPGMRLGWLIPPRRLRAEVVATKWATDLGNPVLSQLVLAHLISAGAYDRHLRAVRARQRTRRDAVLAAVRQHLPGARVEGVAAGLHLLVTLTGPDAPEDVTLAERARRLGVLVHPLSWHRQRPGPPGLVLGYAAHPPDRLSEAVARIAAAARGG